MYQMICPLLARIFHQIQKSARSVAARSPSPRRASPEGDRRSFTDHFRTGFAKERRRHRTVPRRPVVNRLEGNPLPLVCIVAIGRCSTSVLVRISDDPDRPGAAKAPCDPETRSARHSFSRARRAHGVFREAAFETNRSNGSAWVMFPFGKAERLCHPPGRAVRAHVRRGNVQRRPTPLRTPIPECLQAVRPTSSGVPWICRKFGSSAISSLP